VALTATVHQVDLTRAPSRPGPSPRRSTAVSRRQCARCLPRAQDDAGRRRSTRARQCFGDGREPAHRPRHLRPEPDDGVRAVRPSRRRRRQHSAAASSRGVRSAGVDAIVVHRARAPSRSYLWVNDGAVELRPAKHLWGKVTGEGRRAAQARGRATPRPRWRRSGRPGRPRALRRIMNMATAPTADGHGRGDGREASQGGRRPRDEASQAGQCPPSSAPRQRLKELRRPPRHNWFGQSGRGRGRHPGQDGRSADAQLTYEGSSSSARTSTAPDGQRPSSRSATPATRASSSCKARGPGRRSRPQGGSRLRGPSTRRSPSSARCAASAT